MNQHLLDLPMPARADGRHPTRTSEHYTFVPTERVCQELITHGWKVSNVVTTKPKAADRQGFQKHMVRFRRQDEKNDIKVGDSIVEMLAINSHDATTSWRLFGGIFRMVCSNGMVVSDLSFPGIRLPHKGNLEDIINASMEVADKLPGLVEIVNGMQRTMLTPVQQADLAAQAIALRHGPKTTVDVSTVLRLNRPEDDGRDLWRTFNTIQENIMHGGGIGQSENGDFRRLRPVRGMDKNLEVNTGLWDLAVGMVR